MSDGRLSYQLSLTYGVSIVKAALQVLLIGDITDHFLPYVLRVCL